MVVRLSVVVDAKAEKYSVLKKYHFNKWLRIRKAAEFHAVKNADRRVRDRFFIINAKKIHLTTPRLGVIISKRSIPNAVRRNQVRRLIKEWFRLKQYTLPLVDIVVIATYACRDTPSQDLRECLDKLEQKLINYCKSLR